jgi:GH25 family lysozyme M1 (1,4-beta-N-acetylmuramidase)
VKLVLDSNNYHPATAADLKASGSVALITNATEGTSYVNSTLASQRAAARSAGVPFGSYVFLHPNSPGSEASFYLKNAKPRVGDIQPVIDAEVTNLGTTQLALRTQRCAVALEAAGYEPLLYASSSIWKQIVAVEPKLKRLRVWEAQYPGRASRWTLSLLRLRARLRGATVVLWQFTDGYKVGSKTFDCSALLAPLNSIRIGSSL